MRNRKFEYVMDDYLLDRLDQEEKEKFEKHYFNSPCAFRKMLEREEVIYVVKHRGNIIFQDLDDVDRETENICHSDQERDLPSPVGAVKGRIKMEKDKKDG